MAAFQTFLGNPFWLAPMAGVNDAPFRAICRDLGAGMVYTEMVSAKGLHYASGRNNSHTLLRLAPGETPTAVQLFGAEPALLAEQAAAVAEELGDDLAFIDINMGCPVPKVVNKGEGAALMLDAERATAIIRAMKDALSGTGIALTAKIRRGFDEAHENYREFAQALEAAGVDALAVHGRFRSQGYRGTAEPACIRTLKELLTIPVIASGDILDAPRAVAALNRDGADAVLIARGARGNPWIFAQATALRAHPEYTAEERARVLTPPRARERFAVMRWHAAMIEEFFGRRALLRMRKHALWYCAGLPGASHFRTCINELTTLEDLGELIDAYEAYLAVHAPTA